MDLKDKTYITNDSISVKGLIKQIPKSSNLFQPIFEAFTNSLEAIRDKFKENISEGLIKIEIRSIETIGGKELDEIIITDNGIGFNSKCFIRFNKLWDSSKGYKNKGSGRFQYIHFFDKTEIISIFTEDKQTHYRKFILSKSKDFINKDSILYHVETKKHEYTESKTIVKFSGLLENHSTYNSLDSDTLQKEILERYLEYFCLNMKNLPKISIEYFLSNENINSVEITTDNIPNSDEKLEMQIQYSKLSSNGREIVKIDKHETFTITPFIIDKKMLGQNEVKMTSKLEIIQNPPFELDFINKKDVFNNGHFLFLISSGYIDDKDLESDLRGEDLTFTQKDDLSTKTKIHITEDILIEDIQNTFTEKILSKYPEIVEKKEQHNQSFNRLKEMFFINDDDLSIKISLNDSDENILNKFYKKEAEKVAKLDSEIKTIVEGLDSINPALDTYQESLQQEIDKLVRAIPLQNKNTLTHYVARRKLVLDLFDKILGKELQRQKEGKRNIDERLLHNLVFQQASDDTNNSDLWLINEDFLYFKGISESKLRNVTIGGEKLLKSDLTEEEAKFRTNLNEDRFDKRPDILLFPQESKCIIIEFKNPDVNVADHLMQINNYASLIWNFANDKFQINTFYGYLIGLNIDNIDVKFHDNEFKEAVGFDFMFRPHKTISGFFKKDKQEANLYTEVVKYTTLLERSKKRNEIFMKKLGVIRN